MLARQTKDLAEGLKQSLAGQKAKLVTETGLAIDKVLAACDVAENNNRVYCQFMADGHAAGKLQMAKVEQLLQRLETGWDDNVAFAFTHAVGQVQLWMQKLKTDDEQLKVVKMVDEYRGNGWKMAVTDGLAYVQTGKARSKPVKRTAWTESRYPREWSDRGPESPNTSLARKPCKRPPKC